MNTFFLIVLRLIHVLSGTLWIGAAVFYLFFVKPSVKNLAAVGPQFMQQLVNRRRYPAFMSTTSLLTVLAGAALYLIISGGNVPGYLDSGPGVGFSIGAVAGVLAFLVGTFGIGRVSAQMGDLGQQIAASGGPPPADLVVRLQFLEERLTRNERIDFFLLSIALITMATARYWTF